MEIRKLSLLDPYRSFLDPFLTDPDYADPMLFGEEQQRLNLEKALRDPEHHDVLGIFQDGKMTGFFVFLILPEERYFEMLAGLSRDPAAYRAVFSYLEQHYSGWEGDFVFNPRNPLLRAILREKGGEFDPEQRRLVFRGPAPEVDTTGVEPLTDPYAAQYFTLHTKNVYWTGEKTAAAPDRFRILLAIEDGQAVGYLDVTHGLEENEPFDLFVREEFRRKGWGRKLLARALELNRPKGMLLLVDADNLPAIRLYTSMGFVPAAGPGSLTVHWRVPDKSCNV